MFWVVIISVKSHAFPRIPSTSLSLSLFFLSYQIPWILLKVFALPSSSVPSEWRPSLLLTVATVLWPLWPQPLPRLSLLQVPPD